MTAGIRLVSDRLELQPITPADGDALRELLNLEPVGRYLLDGSQVDADWVTALVQDSAATFAERGLGLWTARRKGDAALVGLVGFRDFFEPPVEELIYALHPNAWGQGIATEMATVAIEHAFSAVGREHVRASTDAPNQASLTVLQRLGMRETHREPGPGECPWEQIHCELRRADWKPPREAGSSR